MASKTFSAAGHRVTVRTVEVQRPTGLLSVGWRWPGRDITVVIDGQKHERIGSLMVRDNGNWAFAMGSVEGLWTNYNTLNRMNTAPHLPYSYKSEEIAFKHLCRYIEEQLEGKVHHP
jgi:hypothetical protein